MLKFISKYADKINGIDIYPIISLIIFVVFFAAMLVYVKKMKKSSQYRLLILENQVHTKLN